MLPECLKSPAQKGILFFCIPFSAALWYTMHWSLLDEQGKMTVPGESLFAWSDIPMIILCYVVSAAGFLWAGRFLQEHQRERMPGKKRGYAFPAFLFTFLWWLLFLLAFYPAPGMNDTVYMMDNPLYAVIQFPWAYSLLYGYSAEWGKAVWGSREPVIFLLSLLQILVIAFSLAKLCGWVREKFGKGPAVFLWGYFTFVPLIGNYAAAAVREGIFSLAVLAWMVLFLSRTGEKVWTARHTLFLAAACLGLMLLRSNGLLLAFFLMTAFTAVIRKYRMQWTVFLLCAAISVVPGRMILHQHGWEPLFQESMGIPLQQLGRVLAKNGERDEKTAALMDSLLPEETWRRQYHPYTVDWVKWDRDFQHDRMNGEKKEFLAAWVRTGLKNPGIYLEGWMTETFQLWNLDPVDSGVQSRFGWALSDENTRNMKPADNDRFMAGDFPMPRKCRAVLGSLQYDGARFLGSGLLFWVTIFFCVLFYYEKKREAVLAALPLLMNTVILSLSTPAGSVYRYSFSYVLGLPVLFLWLLYKREKGGEPDGNDSRN